MLDTCVITRGGGKPAWDDAAHDYVTPVGVTIYSGPCRVKAPQTAVTTADVGEQQVTLVPGEVHLPVVGAGYAVDPETDRPYIPTDNDTVTVTAIGPASDPALAGQVLSVLGPHIGSSTTARRLPVKAVV